MNWLRFSGAVLIQAFLLMMVWAGVFFHEATGWSPPSDYYTRCDSTMATPGATYYLLPQNPFSAWTYIDGTRGQMFQRKPFDEGCIERLAPAAPVFVVLETAEGITRFYTVVEKEYPASPNDSCRFKPYKGFTYTRTSYLLGVALYLLLSIALLGLLLSRITVWLLHQPSSLHLLPSYIMAAGFCSIWILPIIRKALELAFDIQIPL